MPEGIGRDWDNPEQPTQALSDTRGNRMTPDLPFLDNITQQKFEFSASTQVAVGR